MTLTPSRPGAATPLPPEGPQPPRFSVARLRGSSPRAMILVGLLVTAIVAAIMYSLLTSGGGGQVVASEDSPSRRSEIVTMLGEAGVEAHAEGVDIMVGEGEVAAAREALAGSSLGSAAALRACKSLAEGEGMLTSTNSEQRLKERTCLETELAARIEQIDGITSASLTIVPAKEGVFDEDAAPPRASVQIRSEDGRAADVGPTVAHMVAAAVSGLNPNDITVVDEASGTSVWDGENGSATTSGKGNSRLNAEKQYNMTVESRLGARFEKIAGKGKVLVQSNVELDMDEIRRQVRDVGGQENQQGPLTADVREGEILDDAGSSTGGVTGTPSNVTGTDGAATDSTSDGGFVSTKSRTSFDNDIVVEDINVAPGDVQRQRLSVIVDDSVSPQAAEAIRTAALTFIGGDPESSVSFSQAPIAAVDEASVDDKKNEEQRVEAISRMIKYLLYGIAGILIITFVQRILNQGTARALDDSTHWQQAEIPEFEPVPLAELEKAMSSAASAEDNKRRQRTERAQELADRQPERVAEEIRRWMKEDTR